MHDVVVIGGGVVGLAIARELALDQSVLLIERGAAGEGTSWAAAGMLSPQSEADHDGPFFQFCIAAMRMYRQFASAVREESGVDPEYIEDGVLVLATTSQEMAKLKGRADWQKAAGYSAEILDPEEVFKLEPLITAEISGALLLPDDHQVAPRRLSKALAEACVRRKVEIRRGVAVDEVLSENGCLVGVRTGTEKIPARHVIVAGGVWSPGIDGLAPAIPVYPRKGQILSLMSSHRMFRHMIRLGHSYFVPRRNGEVVVGATNEDAGFDRTLTPAGLGHLLADAQKISSHTGAFPICETWTGLRPATPDELPIIGLSDISGLFYATGHYRNGVLLAPITAVTMRALLAGQAPPIPIAPFNPKRFAASGGV